MELKRYVALFRRWSWLILLCTALGGGGGWLLSRYTTPVYESSAKLLIDQSRNSSQVADYNSVLASQQLARTYSQMLTARPILDNVIKNLHLPLTPERLAQVVTVNVVRDTQLIQVTAESTNPANAAAVVNALVDEFRTENQAQQSSRYASSEQSLQAAVAKIQDDMTRTQAAIDALGARSAPADIADRDRLTASLSEARNSYATLVKSLEDVRLADAQSTNNVVVVEQAQPDLQPVRPRTSLNMLLGAIAGFLLAIALVFVRDYLDDSVKSTEDVERVIGVSSLGRIAAIEGDSPAAKLVTLGVTRSAIAEAYRVLGANIEFAEIDHPIRTILVSSGSPAEGKSTTVANLAVAMAQMGKRVIAVDSDLRKPTLHKYFSRPNNRGITNALLDHDASVTDYLLDTGVDNLRLLASGPLPPNPANLVGSARMADLIAALSQEADVVLFDSPPSLIVADAALLARACDATVLVIRAGSTRVEGLKRTREALTAAGTHLIGFVLNRVSPQHGGYYYTDYYYYYGEGDDRSDTWRGRMVRRFRGRWPFPRQAAGGAQRGAAAHSARPAVVTAADGGDAGLLVATGHGSATDGALTNGHRPAANGHGSLAEDALANGHSSAANGHGSLTEGVLANGHSPLVADAGGAPPSEGGGSAPQLPARRHARR